MKTELKAKYLHHLLSKKKKDEGFTLVELLVVVIIIGILAAVALPTMLGQASKAREAGGKSGVSVINRAQQAFAAENNGTYAANIAGLGINEPKAENYTFAITGGKETGASKATGDGTLKAFCGTPATGVVDVCAGAGGAGAGGAGAN